MLDKTILILYQKVFQNKIVPLKARNIPSLKSWTLTSCLSLILQDNLIREKDRISKELQRCQAQIRQHEEKQSNLREENAGLKEELSRAQLANDVVEQEKTHLTELYHKTEEQKEVLETECKKVKRIIFLNHSQEVSNMNLLLLNLYL